jgi:hypothetical protein
VKIARKLILLLLVTFITFTAEFGIANAATYPVGYGSANPVPYTNAYNRIGGASRIGYAYNAVHGWGSGCIQDFSGGWSGKGAIMQAGCYGNAYYVVYLQWAYLEGRWGGNAVNVIGYPTGDDFRWGNGWSQNFSGGSQGSTTLARPDQNNTVRQVWGGVRAFWFSIGGAAGMVGYPLNEEYGWNGIRRQDFQGGSIIWDSVNKGRLLSTRESKAVNYVIAEKNSATPAWSEEFGRYWSGYCEGFVEIAFGTKFIFGSAIDHYNWQLSQGRIRTDTNPPTGAVVFYGGGYGYGHVGVSIGSGQVISTQGFNGQTYPIWQHGVTSLSNPYLGWAYAPPSWPGR